MKQVDFIGLHWTSLVFYWISLRFARFKGSELHPGGDLEQEGSGLGLAKALRPLREVYKFYEEQESVETIHSQDQLLLSEVPDTRPFCKSGEQSFSAWKSL